MKQNYGFTLIEILIAMLVLSVGLLGLAGLQAVSLKNNQSAYNRSQATQLAYDLADRMRANASAIASYTAIQPGAATIKTNCLTIAGCTSTDMAENDLYEWNQSITTVLPLGFGLISVTNGIYTITISWDDNRDGDIDLGNGNDIDVDGDGDTDNDPSFQTSFQL